MKKFFLLLVSALALGACTNEEINNNEDINNIEEEPVAAHISATIRHTSSTRAVDTSWTIGDSIGVTMYDDRERYVNIKYIAESTDGVFAGDTMYFRNKREPVTLTAYYPYTGSEGISAGVIEAVTGADSQTSEKQPAIDFLYARAENMTGGNPEVRFNFSHRMSKLTLIFKNGTGMDVNKIRSFDIAGLVLEGTFDTSEGICVAKDETADSLLSINLPDDTGNENVSEKETSVIVFPQSLEGRQVTLKITDSEDQEYSCELKFNGNEILSGNHYQWTIIVNKTGVDVNNSNISDWSNQQSGADAGSVLN